MPSIDPTIFVDLDGDGIADMLTLDAGVVSVRLALGAGAFAAPAMYAAPAAIDGFAVGDFTGDGKPELVANIHGANAIDVAVNNGDGTFATFKPFSSGAIQDEIVVADVTGDKVVDVIGLDTSKNLEVLAGSADGSLAKAVLSPTDVAPGEFPLLIGELTGDHIVDVAFAEDSEVEIFPGKGSGAFGASKTIAVQNFVFDRSAAADVDGDGDVDVLLTSSIANGLRVLVNNGDGTFTAKTTGPASVLLGIFATGDVDGDHVPDAIVADVSAAALVLHGNGDGTFSAGAEVPTASASSVTLADLDGDHVLDLAVRLQDGIAILPGDGHGHFASRSTYPLAMPASGTAVVTPADVDHDGQVDITARDADGLFLLRNGGARMLTSGPIAADPFAPTGAALAAPALVDVDRDGIRDAIVPSATGVDVFPGGAAGFGSAVSSSTGHTEAFLTTGDVNGDGNPDVVAISWDVDAVTVLLGHGDGTFTAMPDLVLSGESRLPPIGLPLVADFDGDGNLDLAINDATGVNVFSGAGDGTFSKKQTLAAGCCVSLGFLDVDEDGHGDVVTSGRYWPGHGDGTFGDPVTLMPSSALPVHDLDGDGHVDLVGGGNIVGEIAVSSGNGDGTFNPARTYLIGGGDVTIADVDGDGRPDVVDGDGRFGVAVAYGVCR